MPRRDPIGHRSRAWQEHYERNRERYYPLFENLSEVLLDPRAYFQALRQFMSEEFHRRVGSVVRGTLLLVAAAVLVAAALGFFLFSSFLYLNTLLANPALSAFAVGWAALILLFVLGFFSMKQFRSAGSPRQPFRRAGSRR